MVSTRTTRFQSPDNTKHNKRKTTTNYTKKKAKYKYNISPNKTNRITDHLIKKVKRSNTMNSSRDQSTIVTTSKKKSKPKSFVTPNKFTDNGNNRMLSKSDDSRKEMVAQNNNNDITSTQDKSLNTIESTSPHIVDNTDSKSISTKNDTKPKSQKYRNKIEDEQKDSKTVSKDDHTNDEVHSILERDNICVEEDNTNIGRTTLEDSEGINKVEELQTTTSIENVTVNRAIEKSDNKQGPNKVTHSQDSDSISNSRMTDKEEELTDNPQNKEEDEISEESQTNSNNMIKDDEDRETEDNMKESSKKTDSGKDTAYNDLILDSVENDIEKELEKEEYDEYLQNNCPDGDSITSKQTVRNHNMHRINEEQSYHSYNGTSESESEDDENTVDSSKSTQYHKATSDKEIPPKNIRYQIGITIPPTDIRAIQKEFESNDDKAAKPLDVFSKIRDKLKGFVTEMKNLDKKSKIISWKDKNTYNILEGGADDLPKTAAGLGQFFNGIRLRREHGRQFIRFRLHASKNPNRLEAQLTEWARLAGHSFYRCVIQEEHSTAIGWLLYSSQYTNTYHLSKHLQRITGFEWGFKLGSITKSDENIDGKPVQWKDRQKAQIVHVPTNKAEVAISKISNLLQAKTIDEKQTPLFFQRYLFIQQENTMVDINSRLKFKHILCRQRAHLDSIKSKFILSIDINMDKRLDTKEGGNLSLREMILSIKTRQEGGTWDPVPLFHSIDFCPDSSKIWIGNSMGPGGPGHIITYYNIVEAEALQMIRGLGVFLAKLYGYENVSRCFSKDHWNSLEGWAFSRKKWKFTTPESRQMNANLKLDPNKMMVRIAQKQIRIIDKTTSGGSKDKTQAGKSKLHSILKSTSPSSPEKSLAREVDDETHSSEMNKAFRANELMLIKKTVDPDLDSIGDNNMENELQPNDIILNDMVSTASSITANTTESHRPTIPQQFLTAPADSASSISTVSSLDSITSSIHSITRDKLESLFEDGMTQQERKERADQYTFQQLRKVMIEKNKLYDSLFPEEEKVPDSEKEVESISQIIIHNTSNNQGQSQDSNKGDDSSLSAASTQLSPKLHTAFSNDHDYNQVDVSTKPDDDPHHRVHQSSQIINKDTTHQDIVSEVSADDTK
jgi:hypothetical protein